MEINEYSPIKEVWNCYSPYIKGRKAEIIRLIDKENLKVINRFEYKGIASCKIETGRYETIAKIIREYPNVLVACVVEGDPEFDELSIAVVFSGYGCNYISSGKIIGSCSVYGDTAMAAFRDLFQDYRNRDTSVDPHSGSMRRTGVKYSFPFMKEWNDENVFDSDDSVDAGSEPGFQEDLYNFVIEGIRLVRYVGWDDTVTIPDGVKTIGKRAFYHNETVFEVTVPKGVTRICESAFEGCGDLHKVNLPDSLRIIRKSAFKNCSHLKSINIPPKIKIIEEDAFMGCEKL